MNEITYNVEIADMKAFQRHHRRVSPTLRRLRLFVLILFSAVSLDSALRHENGSIGFRITYFLILLVMFLVAFGVITYVANWFAQLRAYRDGERHGILGQHTIALTPETLHERTAVNDSKAAWRSLFRIDATPDHIFIFTQPNSAYVIPRRAFPTPSDADAFLTSARDYYAAAPRSA